MLFSGQLEIQKRMGMGFKVIGGNERTLPIYNAQYLYANVFYKTLPFTDIRAQRLRSNPASKHNRAKISGFFPILPPPRPGGILLFEKNNFHNT
jgi:hypothetical protein